MRTSLERVSRHPAARRLTALRSAERRPVLIDELDIAQDDRHLDICLTAGPGVTPRALWLRRGQFDDWTFLTPLAEVDGRYRARIDLLELPPAEHEDGDVQTVRVEIDRILRADSETAQRFAGTAGIEMSDVVDGRVVARYRRVLGTARRTEVGALHAVSDGAVTVSPYVNSRGGLSLAVDRPLKPFGAVHVSRLTVTRGAVHMRGRFTSRHGDVRDAELVLKGRTTGYRITRPVPLDFDRKGTRKGYGLRWYRFDVRLDCSAVLADPAFADDTFDAWFRVRTEQHPEPFEVRIGRTRLITRMLTRPGWAQRGDRAAAVTPYYTFKAKRTSFTVNLFAADNAAYLRRQLRLRHVTRARNWGREVWLVGERPYKAQDTGYWFFRYLRENHPELEAYYVIERDSPERANVEPLGNVVDFGSKEHIRLTLLATKVVGSHHPDFLFPLRTKEFNRAVRATRVFLQHGVMGTKWMASLYGKSAPGFDADLVIASSEREREYLVTDFGFDLDEVAVTGLSRFDSLFADDVAVDPHQILIMPTWRDWLQDVDTYRESDYHQAWAGLLHDPRLTSLVEQHGLRLVFCLHPNMQQYSHLFAGVPARVVNQGEVDV